MKSVAAVAHSPQSPFVVEDVELPELHRTDVLVRIVSVGVCHTDIASRDGQLPAPFPAVFGHEGAGVVERVGDAVTKVAPGDHVVLAQDSDGTCALCASGAPTYCERFLELNFQAGPTGRTARLTDGRSASIKYFGQSSFAHYAVAVGMAAILGAAVCGCTTIIAVDRIDSRLELTRRLGATHAINTMRTPDVGTAIRGVVERGVNFVVDAAGAPALIAAALAGLGKRGTLALVAVPPTPEQTFDMPWSSVLAQGHTVRGFIEGDSIPDVFIPRLCDLYAQGRLPFDQFVRFYPFHEINRAVDDQRHGRSIKPILEVSVVGGAS